MKRIIRKLTSKNGSTYIEMIVLVLVVTLFIVLILKVMPVLILKNNLNTFAKNVSRLVSVEGIYSSEVESKIEEYRVSCEIGDVEISFDETEFIGSSEKIQLNDKIVVTVKKEYDLGFFTFGSFPVTLKNTAISRSEVYWKTSSY